jgi:hypothetical protein
MLVVDRATAAKSGASEIGRSRTSGYVGDYFRIGRPRESWVVESARVWVTPEHQARKDGKIGDFFEKISFAAGIEFPAPPSGQPDCDCHNLIPLQTAAFHTGSDDPDTAGVRVTRVAGNLWQVDFRRLNWTVPGATNLQFGISSVGRPSGSGGPYRLLSAVSEPDAPHQLRSFTENGKMEGVYTEKGLHGRSAIRVQVWAHLIANISIRPERELIEVTLHGSPTFDVRKTQLADLRFGPGKAVAVSTKVVVDAGQMNLVARFNRKDVGFGPNDVNTCLSGRQTSNIPFEGCALVSRQYR